MPRVAVTQKDEEVPTAVLATAIVRIADGFEKLMASDLNEYGLIVLLTASTGVNKTTIKQVLRGIKELKRDYIKQLPKGKEK